MGKRGSYQGESPTDRAAGLMDKFIQRSNRKQKQNAERNIKKRFDKSIPKHLWPLDEQLDYWDSLTEQDRFRMKYPTYSEWKTEVQQRSGMYYITFRDVISNHKDRLVSMYEKCMSVTQSIIELRKEGIIH